MGEECSHVLPGEDLTVEIKYDAQERIDHPYVVIGIVGGSGSCFTANMLLDGCRPYELLGKGKLSCRFKALPLPHAEGRFAFFPHAAVNGLKIPQTDREQIWPWFWRFRGGFFAAHCHCHADGGNEWKLEESWEIKALGPDVNHPSAAQPGSA